jgi:D-3-phosphoglycerate dehydrogenase
MSAAQNIPTRNRDGAVTNSFDPSTSPTQAFTSPSQSFSHRANSQNVSAKQLKPFNTQDVKVLLLENINVTGQDILREQGYQVEALKASIPEHELIEKIKYVFTHHTHHASLSNLLLSGTSMSLVSAQRQS